MPVLTLERFQNLLKKGKVHGKAELMLFQIEGHVSLEAAGYSKQ